MQMCGAPLQWYADQVTSNLGRGHGQPDFHCCKSIMPWLAEALPDEEVADKTIIKEHIQTLTSAPSPAAPSASWSPSPSATVSSSLRMCSCASSPGAGVRGPLRMVSGIWVRTTDCVEARQPRPPEQEVEPPLSGHECFLPLDVVGLPMFVGDR